MLDWLFFKIAADRGMAVDFREDDNLLVARRGGLQVEYLDERPRVDLEFLALEKGGEAALRLTRDAGILHQEAEVALSKGALIDYLTLLRKIDLGIAREMHDTFLPYLRTQQPPDYFFSHQFPDPPYVHFVRIVDTLFPQNRKVF